jgi:hypothetical protein
MNDFAESTVKLGVFARDWAATVKWLENRHPDWTKKQIVEHAGNIHLTAGLMSKDEIAKMSDEDLQKFRTVRRAELAKVMEAGADDVRSEAGTLDRSDQSRD